MDITDAVATAAPERPTYLLARWLFLRLLGLIYLIAFLSLAAQITGLVGEHGVLPAHRFLERAHALYGGDAYRLFPTLCWLGAGDAMLQGLCWGGALVALLVVFGVAQAPALAVLWFLYLSASVVGQTFLWFQWDALLLEAGLLAVLYAPTGLGPSLTRERAPSNAMRWLVWWLLFRLMFLSGITKFASGDPSWRTLTALDYHFWTQPLPTWTAWYAHWMPSWTHRGMLLLIFGIELLVPWLILVPERFVRVRRVAAALLALGQLGIAATGNYGFFNVLTLVLCVPLLDDRALARVLPLRLAAGEREPRWKRRTLQVFVPVIALLSTLAFAREIVQTVPGGRGVLDNPLLQGVAPFRSINGYGLFRVMTPERPEIVIEGSPDTLVWRAYEFRWKPGDLSRRPRFVA
ncbi:MAG TPA: lipase maturation factor family protein, partial [Gemmatimonadales bacterium]|nr:lipase maturation factor family protein [Gemmatimonadales bacterium]